MAFRYKIAFAVLFLLTGCSSGDITSPDQIVFPASNVSYKAQVAPLLSLACNTSGCHDAARQDNAEVDLTSWNGVRAINVVDQPGDTNCGLLLVVFYRDLKHDFALRINDNHRQGLKTWVLEGAQNN